MNKKQTVITPEYKRIKEYKHKWKYNDLSRNSNITWYDIKKTLK